MKKLLRWPTRFLGLLTLMSILTAPASFAQTSVTWYPVEKGQWKTMAWDAVTTLSDNDPLPDPADAALSYNVLIKNKNTGLVIPIASGITTTQLSMVLPKRGSYFGGVQTTLLYTGETVPSLSAIAWSDMAASCQGGVTFGFRFQTAPKDPKALR